MTAAGFFPRSRWVLVIGLVLLLMFTGTGVASARWVIAATATTPVTAGQLTTELSGTAGLGASNMIRNQYTSPVALTVHNPNPVPVDYTLAFAPTSGTLPPAEVGLTVWRPAGTICPATVPATGTATGTLATPPAVPVVGASGGSATVVCAATRFTGALATSGGRSLTVTPTLTAHMTTGSWTATATAASFTHATAAAATPPPGPVTNLTCTSVGDHHATAGVQLAWTPPASGAASYQIRTSTGVIIIANATSPTFLNVNNVSGTNPITLQVVAVGAGGNTSTPQNRNVYIDHGERRGTYLRC